MHLSTRVPCFLLLLAALNCQSPAPTVPAAPATSEPHIATPRTADDGEFAALLAYATTAAKAGADGQALLDDAQLLPLREVTEFRALVRDRAPRGAVRIAPAGEPGTPLVVRVRLEDGAGKPVRDALVYAYHTDARGWYADRAPHFAGGASGGDDGHARLFGYVRTDDEGCFVLHTIRPAGYPRSTLPQHVHVHVEVGSREVLVTEVLFEGDERLTADVRAMAARNHYVIAPVDPPAGEGDDAGAQVARATLVVVLPRERRAR